MIRQGGDFSGKIGLKEGGGFCHEKEAVLGGTDCGGGEPTRHGAAGGDIARKLDIAEQTFYRWKKQYGGLEATEVRELRQLREENTKLKKLVAEFSLDKVMLQEMAAKKW